MERVETDRGDFFLILLIILLAGIGFSLLLSASYPFSARTYDDPLRLAKRQLIWIALGGIGAFVTSLTPLSFVRSAMPPILLGTLILALMPFIPGIGVEMLGSRRWISVFGQSFQPSEIVKVVEVLYLASYFARSEERGRETLNDLVPPLIVICVFAAIIYLQNDYSTAIFVLFLGLAMLYFTRARFSHFLIVSAFTAPLGFILLFAREHRVRRFLAFLDTSSDRLGTSYQIVSSQSALVSGGLWGKGLGRSAAKLGALPEAHSDFIYSVLGEETGFLGAVLVLALFALLAWRGYGVAWRCRDRFRSGVAFGFTTAISLQVLLHVAVAVGMVPTTGVTLPFFSAGGSSLLATLLMSGFLVNISRSADDV